MRLEAEGWLRLLYDLAYNIIYLYIYIYIYIYILYGLANDEKSNVGSSTGKE